MFLFVYSKSFPLQSSTHTHTHSIHILCLKSAWVGVAVSQTPISGGRHNCINKCVIYKIFSLFSISEGLSLKCEELVGTPMVYELVEYARECLTDNNLPCSQCSVCQVPFQVTLPFSFPVKYNYGILYYGTRVCLDLSII